MAPNPRRRTRRKTQNVRRRRPFRGRRGMRNTRAIVPVGIPNSQFVKLRYSELVGTSGTINLAKHCISMNSLYDPQISSDFSSVSGHSNNGQPLYRDQWAAFYYNYKVFASKIKVTWQPYQFDTTNAGTPSTVGIALYPAANVTTDTDICITKQRTGCKFVMSGGAGFTQRPMDLKAYHKCNTALGLSRRSYADDSLYQGGLSSGSSPATQAVWNIVVQDISTAQDLYGYLHVEVKYYAKLYNRVENVAAS